VIVGNCAINMRSGKGFGVRDRWFKIDDFSTADGAAGQRNKVLFDGGAIPAGVLDKIDRVGHLTALAWIGRLTLNTDPAMPQPLPGVLIYSAIRDIRLRAGGHDYLVGGVDGMDLDDDNWLRMNDPLSTPPADVPVPVAPVTVTRDIALVWELGRPNDDEGEARALDGAIPLSLLDPENDSTAGLSFLIDTGIHSSGGDTELFPGVTSGGFITPGEELELYACIRYADELHSEVPWELRVGSTTDTKFKQRYGAICDYLVIRDRVDGAGVWMGGMGTVYSEIRHTSGDEQVIDGRTTREVIRGAGLVTLLGDRMLSGAGALSPRIAGLVDTDPLYIPLVWGPGGHRRSGGASGMNESSYVRTGQANTRLIGRGWGEQSAEMEAKARCGLPGYGEGAIRTVAAATVNNKALALATVLPVNVTPAGK
jgi:hypothetical protein